MTKPNNSRLVAFGLRLRALRVRAGYLTGKEFAQALGWQQSKVSRIETGNQQATDSDVVEWLRATQAPESLSVELRNELREIQIDAASWRRQLSKGHADRQQRAAKTEQKSSRIRALELALLPGLVHTADYARATLTAHARLHEVPPDVEKAVEIRMERQRVLYDSGKSIEMLIMESALRTGVCPPGAMVAQMDRLLAVAGLPSVRLGIIPLDTHLPVIPMHGVWIFDDSVTVETNDSEITTDDPADLALYNRLMDQLWTVAVTGDDARAVILECANRWAAAAKGNKHA